MSKSAGKTLQVLAFPLWSVVSALAMLNGSQGNTQACESQQSNRVHQRVSQRISQSVHVS